MIEFSDGRKIITAQRLGHGSIATTNKYLHCLAEADEQAALFIRTEL